MVSVISKLSPANLFKSHCDHNNHYWLLFLSIEKLLTQRSFLPQHQRRRFEPELKVQGSWRWEPGSEMICTGSDIWPNTSNNHPSRRFLCVFGCFLKWWYPQNTPKWSFLVGKPMVVGYHHFRKPPFIYRWGVLFQFICFWPSIKEVRIGADFWHGLRVAANWAADGKTSSQHYEVKNDVVCVCLQIVLDSRTSL